MIRPLRAEWLCTGISAAVWNLNARHRKHRPSNSDVEADMARAAPGPMLLT